MADTTATCSSTSLAHDEPLFATASLVRSWLLLEQPGTWGADALGQSGLPTDVAQALHQRSVQHDVRILLLRRPEPDGTTRSDGDGARQCFLTRSAPPDPWVEERTLARVDEVLNIDLAALAAGPRPGLGRPWGGRLYAVCTNSRHDPCCGRLGRPIVQALAGTAGLGAGAVWECSHMGGERFAANLVCFPHGLYFGRLDPPSALTVVAGYERGEIELDHYRGRAGEPFVVQAADHYARQRLGLRGVDDLVYEGHRRAGAGRAEVRFGHPGGGRLWVTVAGSPDPEPRPLTCRAPGAGHPPSWSLVDLREG